MRNQTLAVVISSMLMAAASQAQPAPTIEGSTDTTVSTSTQTETTGSTATVDSGTTSTTMGAGVTTTTETPNSYENLGSADADQSRAPHDSARSGQGYDADKMNKSDASAMAQQRWREADTDRNGTLSQAELQASMPNVASNFREMDTNGDGQLSQDEMHNFKKSEKSAQWNLDMKAADTDRDGSLTLAEAQNGMPALAPHFSTIDTDKDGKLSRQEIAAHQRTVRGTGSDESTSMDADTSTRTSTSTSTTITETGVDAGTQYGTQSDTEATQGHDDTHGTSNQ